MLQRLIKQIRFNLEHRSSTSESNENWRNTINPNISKNNPSKEVRLEKALAAIMPKESWWNQMPIASGLVASSADRRRAIDLVHQRNGDKIEFDLVELKIDSDTPLFALMEIGLYGLVYLVLRQQPQYLSPASSAAQIFRAEKIHLRVLAPRSHYTECNVTWLQEELSKSLNMIAHEWFDGALALTVSSNWSSELEKWEDDAILSDKKKLASLLIIDNWQNVETKN